MKNILSLAEIEELRKATREVIAEIIREETKDGAKTARELAEATNGLCSSYHIANTVCSNRVSWDARRNRGIGYYEDNSVEYHPFIERKTRHLAELNEDGDIIRKFDIEQIVTINKYKMK